MGSPGAVVQGKARHPGQNAVVIGQGEDAALGSRQINRDGWTMGPLKWPGNTTAQFRRNVMIPWFNHYLRGERCAVARGEVVP